MSLLAPSPFAVPPRRGRANAVPGGNARSSRSAERADRVAVRQAAAQSAIRSAAPSSPVDVTPTRRKGTERTWARSTGSMDSEKRCREQFRVARSPGRYRLCLPDCFSVTATPPPIRRKGKAARSDEARRIRSRTDRNSRRSRILVTQASIPPATRSTAGSYAASATGMIRGTSVSWTRGLQTSRAAAKRVKSAVGNAAAPRTCVAATVDVVATPQALRFSVATVAVATRSSTMRIVAGAATPVGPVRSAVTGIAKTPPATNLVGPVLRVRSVTTASAAAEATTTVCIPNWGGSASAVTVPFWCNCCDGGGRVRLPRAARQLGPASSTTRSILGARVSANSGVC